MRIKLKKKNNNLSVTTDSGARIVISGNSVPKVLDMLHVSPVSASSENGVEVEISEKVWDRIGRSSFV